MAAYAIQFRRGTTTEHSSFTGLLGEVTVDTTKKTIVVHDGSTAGGSPLALEGGAVSTSTGAFSSNVTVGGTLGVTGLATMSGGGAMTGDLTMTGHIIPSANITYDLGSSTKMWKDIYVGPGSLYVNGKKVIEDDSGAITISTDVDEDLKITTTGTGTLKLTSSNGINLTGELGAVSGDLQIGDHMDMNSSRIKELAAPGAASDATNKTYVDATAATAVTGGSNAGSFTSVTTSGNAIVGGNLTVNGTTTSVNTTQVTFEDNIFVLNSNTTGTPSENSGFEVERGDSLNVQFLWNEADDRWTTGSNTFHAGAIVAATTTGNLVGNVTGNVDGVIGQTTPAVVNATNVNATGTIAGALTGNVTGNVSGSAGTVTSIAAHIVDEDNMASDSAVYVPSQQSVKAYVTSQIATKDNTDEMTEGSTNLYHTTARARAAISASGSLSYDNSTGVMSFTMNDETVQDIVGGMVTGNTETGIAVTYDDADGTMDFVVASQTDENFTTADHSKLDGIEASATADQTDAEIRTAVGAASDSNIFTDADHSKLDAIEGSADVTDGTNVAAAGAVMESDSTTAAMSYVLDEDNMVSDSATKLATQQSIKAHVATAQAAAIASAESKDAVRKTASDSYTDAAIATLTGTAGSTLDTLGEIATALGNDAALNTTLVNSIALKLPKAGGTMGGNIAMGGNDITGGGDATFTNFNGTATFAKYADLAERYSSDASYDEGTVVMFGGDMEVTASSGYGSMKIAGVVSTKPAFAMNAEAGNDDTHPFVALQGRVPCKVMGDVSKGDILVASDTSGVATKWMDADSDPRMTAYIGIAISDAVDGMVEVKVGK